MTDMMIRQMKKTLAIALLLLPLASYNSVYASDVIDIVALVNGQPISKFDLDQQTKLLLATSNIQASAENIKQARARSLEQLIENILRRQEAEKHSLRVSKKEIDQSIQRAIGADQSVEDFVTFLDKNGVYANSLYAHIGTDILWRKTIERKIVPRIVLNQKEVDVRLAQVTQNLKQPNFLLSWIVLRFENKQSEQRARELAAQLKKQLRQGASFDSLARNFSAGPNASQGGDLGWVPENGLPAPLRKSVRRMKLGSISQPVRLADGFYLIWLRDRRKGEDAPAAKTSLRLTALRVPVAIGDSARSLQQRVRKQFPGCEQASDYAQRIGGDINDLGFVPTSDLSKTLRRQFRKAKIGAIIPSLSQDGLQEFLALCARKVEAEQSISRRMIENRMLNEEAQIRARQKLRDLHRDASIEQR